MSSSGARGRFRIAPEQLHRPEIHVAAAQARHMRVMRLRVGDRVCLFDGSGAELDAEIRTLGSAGATAVALSPVRTGGEPALQITLVQALPVKLARMDTIVRQATELGVAGVAPVIAAFSQIPRGGEAVIVRRAERWRRIVETAAMQCGRSVVPTVAAPVGWAQLDWSSLPPARLLLDPEVGEGTLTGAVMDPAPDSAALMVGPEGGWAPEEVAGAVEHGATRVSLGPRTLRADSAGVAALAVLQYAWGDLG